MILLIIKFVFWTCNDTAKTEIIHQCRLKLAYVDNDDEELPSDSDEYEDVRALSYAQDASQHTAPLQPTTQSSSSDNSDNDIGAVYSHSLRTQNGFLSKQRKQCVRDQTRQMSEVTNS